MRPNRRVLSCLQTRAHQRQKNERPPHIHDHYDCLIAGKSFCFFRVGILSDDGMRLRFAGDDP